MSKVLPAVLSKDKMKKQILSLLSIALLCSCSESGNTYISNVVSESSLPNVFVNEKRDENRIDDNYRNFYEIFVCSFADSNGDGVGDLNGVTAKLDYLSNLGYTGIWLSPIFASNSYHKYNTKDYFTIDSSFGTMDDLKTLVNKAHSLGIKVILDGVFNHSSQYCSWFTSSLLAHQKKLRSESMTAEEEQYDSLYVFYDSLEEAKKSGKKYYKAGGNDFYYEGNFDSDMPEFDFDSEFTYTKIQSVIDYYMADDIGIDGFRLDAVKYYKLGEDDENVKILSRISKMVKDNDPKGYCVGECWDNNSTITKYYQSDLDSYFWFPGATNDGTIASSTNNEGRLKGVYYRGQLDMIQSAGEHVPAPFLSNHDTGRVTKTNDQSMMKFRLGLLGMSTGASFIYYGEEIGMNSSNTSGGDYTDSNYRTHYYWDDNTHAMECHDVEHALAQTQYYPASNQQLEDDNSLLNYEKEVNRLRNTYPFIARGKMVDLSEDDQKHLDTAKDNLLVIDKEYEGEVYKLLFNFSSSESASYTSDTYKVRSVLLADNDVKAQYVDSTLTLPSHSIAVLTK